MTEHQKEILKFLVKPIWSPLKGIAWAIKEMFTTWFRCISGEDSTDAWAAFVIPIFILFMVTMYITIFTMGFYWKTFLGIALALYLGFYYYRECKKRM